MIKTKQDIELEVVPVREMKKEEVETVARILFNTWKREFEKDDTRSIHSGDYLVDVTLEEGGKK